jgi:signal transduction histidine kinase
VATLVLGTGASVLVAREILYSRVDENIDHELAQETSELERLARGTDPETGEPFGRNVRRIFSIYFERNTPSRNEALLTFVKGEPYLRSRLVLPYNLHEDAELVAHWGDLAAPERGSVDTPVGAVEFLAVPIKSNAETLGVFVVAVFRDLEREAIHDAIDAVTLVALAVLVMGSLLVWRAAERVLRPVHAITQTARSITETDLSRRIPVEGDDELARLAATINDMLGRLDRAFAGQRRFLDDVGHELKTPLTIVFGHLEVDSEDAGQQEGTRAIVLDELERMRRIVGDLLLLAKAERPDFLRLATVDVATLTEELAAKMASLGERRWQVEKSGRGRIVADRQRLTQAVMQVAENAVKHTEDGDVIGLGSSVSMDAARFWVRDTGPGIPPAEQKRIFERLVRGSGAALDTGLGLGLTIVRAIAEAHHGHVEVESSPAGTTFTLVFPLDQPEGAEAA